MLRIIQGPIANRGQNLANDENGVAVEVVSRASCHDDCSRHMEAGEDHAKQWATPFVDAEADADTEESVDLYRE